MKTTKNKVKHKHMEEVLRFAVAGLKHSDYQRLKSINVGDKVRMFWERNNAFDPNAIRLEIAGHKIGYVPKNLTQELHTYRKNEVKLEAEVTAYAPTNPTWVQLYVKVMAPATERKVEDEL